MDTTRTKIGVFGATGRMGKAVLAEIASHFADRAIAAAAISTRSGGIEALADTDVVIDFSLPSGTALLVDWLQAQEGPKPALVCGTTGLAADLRERLAALGESTKVLYATNFSAGVAALVHILRQAAPVLETLGYTPVVTETHHRHKLDAPSGTAKTLLDVLATDDVQVHSIRAGEVIGEHIVTFHGAQDEIVIGHDAKDRGLFARGAVDAALWLARLPATSAVHTMDSYFRSRYLEQS